MIHMFGLANILHQMTFRTPDQVWAGTRSTQAWVYAVKPKQRAQKVLKGSPEESVWSLVPFDSQNDSWTLKCINREASASPWLHLEFMEQT